jgi:thiamine-monophosphate kinase
LIDPAGKKVLISTEMFMEGVHFDLLYTPLHHLGYKCIAASVSDIAAMNGHPTQVFVSIGISNKFSIELVEEIFMGIRIACEQYSVDLAGGDTTTSRHGLAINVTVAGEVRKDRVVYRNGAQTGDLICVSGDLGSAYVGLHLLEREKRVFMDKPDVQPDLQGNEYVLKRQLRPEARTDIVKMLEDIRIIPTAMIDISDGLSSDLLHICNQSGSGCRIYDQKLPMDPGTKQKALDLNLEPTTCILNGGEDYELLFTIRQKQFKLVDKNPEITVIGHITEKNQDCKLVTGSGSEHQLLAQGWQSFKGPDNQ